MDYRDDFKNGYIQSVVDRVNAGDERARSEFARHSGILRYIRVAARKNGITQQWLDVAVSHVLVRIDQSIYDFNKDFGGNIDSYFALLVKYGLGDVLRDQARQHVKDQNTVSLDAMVYDDDNHDTLLDTIPSYQFCPHKDITCKQTFAHIMHIIDNSLTPKYRPIVRKHLIENFTKEEICAEYKMLSNTFDSIISLSRKHIRLAMKKPMPKLTSQVDMGATFEAMMA